MADFDIHRPILPAEDLIVSSCQHQHHPQQKPANISQVELLTDDPQKRLRIEILPGQFASE